jgi:hypothetical protein
MFFATGLPGYYRFGGDTAPFGAAPLYRKPDAEMEQQALKRQAESLQSELDAIRQRLAEFGSENASS